MTDRRSLWPIVARREFVERVRDGYGIGENEPDGGAGDDRCENADEDCDARDTVEATLEIVLLRRLFEFSAHGCKLA